MDTKIESFLTRIGQQATCLLKQQPELGVSVRRTHVFHDPLTPASYSAIWTAVAPDAVLTRRMNATPPP